MKIGAKIGVPYDKLNKYLGLLETYTGAGIALSLRRLTRDYVGPAITVRRASDDATSDIGFTGDGDLDTAALTSFSQSGNVFVTDWYNQLDTRKLSQTTAANQPQIVSSGTVITAGGQSKPAIRFTSSEATFLQYTATASFLNDWYFVSAVESNQANGTTGSLVNGADANNRVRILGGGGTNAALSVRINGGSALGANSIWTSGTGQIYSIARDGSDEVKQFINAASGASATGTKGGAWPVFHRVGANHNGGVALNSDVQEIIIWDSNQASRIAIETDLKNYYIG
jgi:hypothetical protein